jgi:hypothetical protein
MILHTKIQRALENAPIVEDSTNPMPNDLSRYAALPDDTVFHYPAYEEKTEPSSIVSIVGFDFNTENLSSATVALHLHP